MAASLTQDTHFLAERAFVRRLHLEQKRTERSHRPFIFVLIESTHLFKPSEKDRALDQVLDLLLTSFRETDVKGWYKDQTSIGLILTEIGSPEVQSVGTLVAAKIQQMFQGRLTPKQVSQIFVSFHVFPEDWSQDTPAASGSDKTILYADSARSRRFSQLAKRSLDIVGSLIALIAGSPVLLAIAAAVKLTSRGPIFFRQQRVGQYGRRFTFLKFRSMYVNSDQEVHKAYVKSLIAGTGQSNHAPGSDQKVYKLTNDPRITRVGGFLRKTSLDELPQFINVLIGQMSLVGPRPPIPYEVESYDIWHRRRLLAVKPGITGLWQVHGRCRTTFDEMVRLDLRYAQTWSVWLDLKILLRTPRAVFNGDGAY